MARANACLLVILFATLSVHSLGLDLGSHRGLLGVAQPSGRLGGVQKELDASLLEEDELATSEYEADPEMKLLEFGHGHELNDLTELETVSLDYLHEEDSRAEKIDVTTDFDCADEVVLRLAIAESFYGPSYDKCVEELTKTTFAPGGSGEKMMQPSGSGGSGLTREQVQQRVHSRCITRQGHGVALGPRLIRMTFHDSADYNNSMLADGSEVVMKKVWHKDGLFGFWAGVKPNIARTFLVNAAELGTYDEAKQQLQPYLGSGLFSHVAASGCAGFVSACTSTPVDVIKTRLMNSAGGHQQYSGMADAGCQILKQEGPLALYKGFLPICVRKLVWCGVFFVSYEQIRAAVNRKA